MNWRTELRVSPSRNRISLSNKIFTIGSCFSDEIGQHLLENKFTVSKNPFGTVYNPMSIHKLLLFGLDKTFPSSDSYSQKEGIHFNYHFHSSFSSSSRINIESKIHEVISESNAFLKNANCIIITYGTAFAYQLKEIDCVVANCHKMPSSIFEKKLLSEKEIVDSFQEIHSKLKSVNRSARIILTVSPVRHLKDTLELNSVSKSVLRLACHSISNQFTDVEYFPAYEILLDDLRDYRFYKSDLLHPSKEAVEYICGKFIDAYFDESTKKFISEWNKIKDDLAHKAFFQESDSHQKFLKSLLVKLENLRLHVDVDGEISSIKSRILDKGKN
jgi:hypothetical protein